RTRVPPHRVRDAPVASGVYRAPAMLLWCSCASRSPRGADVAQERDRTSCRPTAIRGANDRAQAIAARVLQSGPAPRRLLRREEKRSYTEVHMHRLGERFKYGVPLVLMVLVACSSDDNTATPTVDSGTP